jgi:DNA-binding winged helix-turn-helix (wHTH) protein
MVEEGFFTFGDFRLIPAQRILLREGMPLHLSSRALDILIALVESETIPKGRLIAHAWPDTVVGPQLRAITAVSHGAPRGLVRRAHHQRRVPNPAIYTIV